MNRWKPGDVAMVTEVPTAGFEPRTFLCVRVTQHVLAALPVWMLVRGADGTSRADGGFIRDPNVTEVRPVVLIDPDDTEEIARLYAALNHLGGFVESPEIHSLFANALREFAAPTPPKPDEPQGLGAVVEDDRGIRFVRTYSVEHDTAWVTGNHRRPWSEVDAVRVLSEGVTP